MSRRHFIDNAPTPTFGPIGTSDTSWTVSAATGLPTSFPFNATLDLGTASQENVSITAISGTTVTVVRNIDGLGAFSHAAGATLNHTALAVDFDEANAHVNSNSGVHGVTGSVVGTTDAQTLSNKTFAGLALTAASGVVGLTVTGDNTGDLIDLKNGSTTVGKFDKDGKLTAASLTTGGTAAITGNTTVGGTLGVTGTTTAAAVNATNVAASGTLGVTGTATLHTVTATSVANSGNETIGGTLGITGTTTAAAVSATTLSTSGAATLASASVTGALTVGGKLTLVSPPTIQEFTSGGTWTKPTGLVAARVRVNAAGGGSGGTGTGAGGQASSGGGAGGGYSEDVIAAASLGSTETVTVGAAGAAASSGSNTGGTGGTSSFGAHLSATGGAGGTGMSATTTTTQAAGGVGGVGSGGTVNLSGSDGGPGIVIGGIAYWTGTGGAAQLGAAQSINNAGKNYGGGGAGTPQGNVNSGGLAGAPGVVIVECFFS